MRRDDKRMYTAGFDKTFVKDAAPATTEKELSDISRMVENGMGRYRAEAGFRIMATLPGKAIAGTLEDGEYVVGTLKGGSVIRSGTAIVLDKWDTGLTVSLGIRGKETLCVNAFDGSQATGTVTVIDDCNTYIIEDTYVIMTIAGATPTMKVGDIELLIEHSKTATTTFMPSR